MRNKTCLCSAVESLGIIGTSSYPSFFFNNLKRKGRTGRHIGGAFPIMQTEGKGGSEQDGTSRREQKNVWILNIL